jgi:N utilization substance protein B
VAVTGRRGARRLLVQALYQQQIARHELAELVDQFAEGESFAKIDGAYFRTVLGEVLADIARLDAWLTEVADRPVAQLDPVEHGILWLGLCELADHPDVPSKVVISEAVGLAREFGAQDGHKYVNALLEQLAPRLRGSAAG